MICMQIPKNNIQEPGTKNALRKFNTINNNQSMALEIHKLSKLFFNEIPKSKLNKKNIEFRKLIKL